jgi:hypothetical protein
MVLLFAFEFIEGNTITRLYFMRLRRLTRQAIAAGGVPPELARARSEQLASYTCSDCLAWSTTTKRLDAVCLGDRARGGGRFGTELRNCADLSLERRGLTAR